MSVQITISDDGHITATRNSGRVLWECDVDGVGDDFGITADGVADGIRECVDPDFSILPVETEEDVFDSVLESVEDAAEGDFATFDEVRDAFQEGAGESR